MIVFSRRKEEREAVDVVVVVVVVVVGPIECVRLGENDSNPRPSSSLALL